MQGVDSGSLFRRRIDEQLGDLAAVGLAMIRQIDHRVLKVHPVFHAITYRSLTCACTVIASAEAVGVAMPYPFEAVAGAIN